MAPIDEMSNEGHPFNSTLETGIRALIVLEAVYPRRCDLMEITWYDHLVVHTGDMDGDEVPDSLHPDLPNRLGELLVRRQLVERSLHLMRRMHLVEIFETDNGIEFGASEEAPSYIALLQAPYSQALKQRANWLARRFANLTTSDIKTLIENKIGRWTADFRANETSTGLSL